MKLVLFLATTLFFYTQATKEKKCIKEYVLTESVGLFYGSQNDCRILKGDMASEDLKDRLLLVSKQNKIAKSINY